MAERRGFHRQEPGPRGMAPHRPGSAGRQRAPSPGIELPHHAAAHHSGPHRHGDRPGPGRPAPPGRRRADASAWHWLLFLPILLPLAIPLYNRIEPTLFGLPFFFWCQLAFAIFSTTVITAVHLLRKGP